MNGYHNQTGDDGRHRYRYSHGNTLKALIEKVNTLGSPTRLHYGGFEVDKIIRVSKNNPWGEAVFPTTVFITKFGEDGSTEKSSIRLDVLAAHIGKRVHLHISAPENIQWRV
jgi:hypothetical protein